jgi:hypothetical protein
VVPPQEVSISATLLFPTFVTSEAPSRHATLLPVMRSTGCDLLPVKNPSLRYGAALAWNTFRNWCSDPWSAMRLTFVDCQLAQVVNDGARLVKGQQCELSADAGAS